MDSNVNYTVVGLFVITLFASIALGIIWLSSGLTTENYQYYTVYMQESVSGLSIDAPVEYNGVNVGNVDNIELSHKNPKLVELLLSIKGNTPITRGTVASVNTKGLTGIGFISLRDTGTDVRPLVKTGDEPYPVIKTAPSLFLRWDTALNKLNASLSDASKAFQNVFDPENQQSIKQTLINLRIITENLAKQNERLNLILENTAAASQSFYPMLKSSRTAIETFQTQTLPAANRLMINLDGISRNLYEISNELRQNPSVLIRGKVQQPLGPGEK